MQEHFLGKAGTNRQPDVQASVASVAKRKATVADRLSRSLVEVSAYVGVMSCATLSCASGRG
jgi:hypothetical protein